MNAFEGDVVQIDYRDDGTIKALHVVDDHGSELRITIELPPDPMEDIPIGQEHVVFLNRSRRPRVRIEGPATAAERVLAGLRYIQARYGDQPGSAVAPN